MITLHWLYSDRSLKAKAGRMFIEPLHLPQLQALLRTFAVEVSYHVDVSDRVEITVVDLFDSDNFYTISCLANLTGLYVFRMRAYGVEKILYGQLGPQPTLVRLQMGEPSIVTVYHYNPNLCMKSKYYVVEEEISRLGNTYDTDVNGSLIYCKKIDQEQGQAVYEPRGYKPYNLIRWKPGYGFREFWYYLDRTLVKSKIQTSVESHYNDVYCESFYKKYDDDFPRGHGPGAYLGYYQLHGLAECPEIYPVVPQSNETMRIYYHLFSQPKAIFHYYPNGSFLKVELSGDQVLFFNKNGNLIEEYHDQT